MNFEEQIMPKENMEEHIFMPYGGCWAIVFYKLAIKLLQTVPLKTDVDFRNDFLKQKLISVDEIVVGH